MDLDSAPQQDAGDVEDITPHPAARTTTGDEGERERISFYRRLYLILLLGSCLDFLGVILGIFFIDNDRNELAPLFLFLASIAAYCILVIFHQRWPQNVISFALFKVLLFAFLLLLFRNWRVRINIPLSFLYPFVTLVILQTVSSIFIVFAFINLYLLTKLQLSLAWIAVPSVVVASALFAILFFLPGLPMFSGWGRVVIGIVLRVTSYCVSLVLVIAIVTYVLVDISRSYQRFGLDERVLSLVAVHVDIVLWAWHVLSCQWYARRKEETSQ